jgi:hypothetical protein
MAGGGLALADLPPVSLRMKDEKDDPDRCGLGRVGTAFVLLLLGIGTGWVVCGGGLVLMALIVRLIHEYITNPTYGSRTGIGGLSLLVERLLSLSAFALPRRLCILLVKPLNPPFLSTGDKISTSSRILRTGSLGVKSSAFRLSWMSSEVAVVEEWEREGLEDIRSIGRCGRGISSNTRSASSSDRSEDMDKGDWNDIVGARAWVGVIISKLLGRAGERSWSCQGRCYANANRILQGARGRV